MDSSSIDRGIDQVEIVQVRVRNMIDARRESGFLLVTPRTIKIHMLYHAASLIQAEQGFHSNMFV